MLKTIKRGFTLIELLVVIAIIALLLAILMPSLKKAKERAKQTVCKSNLKGVGLSIKLYLNDYDDRTFAYSGSGRPGNRYRWFDPATGMELDPDAPLTYWGLAYNDYSKNPKVFSCPTFAREADSIYPIQDGDILGGFGLNPFFRDMKVTSIRNTAEFIIAQDHVEPGPEAHDMFYIHSTSYGYNLQDYREVGGSNDRTADYKGIFRHAKKSAALDNPANTTRIDDIMSNPNGQSNTLRLDGSVDGMNETTGQNVRESWYSGR